MWISFVINDILYLLNPKIDEGVEIVLTDLENIWSTKPITNTEFIAQFEDLNPLLAGNSMSTREIIDKLIQFSNSKEITSDIKLNIDTNVVLQMNYTVDRILVKFEFNFHELDKKAFTKELVVPLVQTVNYLEHSQRKLKEKLAKKDKLILEYKTLRGELDDSVTTPSDDVNNVPTSSRFMLNVFYKSDDVCSTFSKNYETNLISPAIKETFLPPKKKQKTNKALPFNKMFDKN